MTSKNWSRIKEIVDEAIHRMPEERQAFLDVACGGNDSVRREVDSLLSSLERAEGFMDAPAFEAVTEQIDTLNEGEVIGHYELLRKLGEGGMGVVYLGRDTKLDRLVAIKVLNKRYERQGDNVRRFVREAKAASALNHPNILTIYEVGEFEGAHFIVSEYIEGRTLREIIKSASLELSMIVDIAGQVAGALAAAHKARIVHRDLKPENVIVRDDGYVKVLDFGLAKLVPENESGVLAKEISRRQNTTASGMILGTVNYMSPEQAKGEKVDERTDIFSLGVVLYEMVSRKRPFEGNSTAESFANLINKQPEPLDSHTRGVPVELQLVVTKMLRKDREARYQTMRELVADLRQLANNNRSDSTFERTAGSNSDNLTAVLPQTTGGGVNTTAETTGSRARWYRRRPLMAALGVLLLVSIVLGGYLWLQRIGSLREIRSVAVMPFVNETGDPQAEYLSDGMTDTLITSLSELPNIKVKARTSVFRYKGKEIDPKVIGKELGVQAIVNGRVAQRDGRTNVLLEVVDTETEDVIFSTRYDKPQSELVTLQSDIARDVSGKLKGKLSGAEEAKVTKTHTADPEALQLYLQGQFHRYKGGRSNALRATDYFKKAIEKDPNYALPYAGLALNYSRYSFYNLTVPGQEANSAAKRALELDDSLPEAHVAFGYFGGDWEQEFRRAIELNPNYAEPHDGLCIFRTYQKRFDEAIAEGKKALELDPSSVIVATDLGAAYFFARHPDEAIEILTRAYDMDPTLWVPLGYLGAAQTLKGQYAEAAATFRKATEISDGSPNAKSHLAYALARTGQREEALKLIDELKRLAEREHINTFHFAVPYIGLGNKDEAFFWLGKGVDEGSIGFKQLDVHPWFDDLRSDPRFEALLIRAKQPK
jgi:eukaryotic-like serine/threonine-protein kinase